MLRQWPLFLFRLHFLLGCMEKFITREHVFSKHRDFQIWTLQQLLDLQLSVAKNRLSSKSWIGNLCCWSLRKDEFLELDGTISYLTNAGHGKLGFTDLDRSDQNVNEIWSNCTYMVEKLGETSDMRLHFY